MRWSDVLWAAGAAVCIAGTGVTQAEEIPFAPATTVPACAVQPSEREKILNAIRFNLSRWPAIRPAIEIGGKPSALNGPVLKVENPAALLLAQPRCCQISDEENESWNAPFLRARLGDNFGGFARVRVGSRQFGTESLQPNVGYIGSVLVLDACGNPVYDTRID
jgi:hypothetical protein